MRKELATRQASSQDEDFVWSVYSETVRPLIQPMLKAPWDEQEERTNFLKIWDPNKTHVINLDGQAIGWLAGDESGSVVTVDHFYIRETHRGQGFGGKVLQELLTRWKAAGKPVEFSVLKGVRAMNFVTRLGGKVVGDEGLTERLRVL